MSDKTISPKGQERFATFNLMYNHPLTDYIAIDDDGGKSLNVLLLGNLGDNGIHDNKAAYNEIFKVVFSCGQYPGCKLAITIASTDASKLKQEFYLSKDGDECRLRELKRFIEEKGYAYLDFQQASIEGGRLVMPKIDLSQSDFGYAIIHTGFEDMDRQAKEILKKELPDAAVWTYKDFFDINTPKDREVYRIAGNISFSYEMTYKEATSKVESLEKFDRIFAEDYANEDFISAGKNYDADSSIASAAHIPCKLRLCKEYFKEHSQKYESKEDLQVLIDAINKQDVLFNKLVSLEHRRWNAYMLTRGYHFPSEEELERIFTVQEYNFTDETGQEKKKRYVIKQKNNYEMWHICLCDCSEQGTLLKQKDDDYWQRQFNNPDPNLSELDQASIIYYKKACEWVIDEGKLLSSLWGAEFSELKESIVKMLRDGGVDSVLQYEQLAEEVGLSDELKHILWPVREKNYRRNFYDTDAELISMLPFCIWHGKDYNTVITVTNGNAVDDVKVPVLLCALNAVFVICKDAFEVEEARDKYKENIEIFFKGRGNNTKIEFEEIKLGLKSPELTGKLVEIIKKYSYKKSKNEVALFDCHNEATIAIAWAAGQANVPLLIYDRRKGLITHGDAFCSALNNKNMSIKEFMLLNNRKVLDVGDNPFSNRQAWILEKAVNDFKAWNSFIKSFVQKNCSYNDLGRKGNEQFETTMTFNRDVLERCGIKEFIDKLIKYKVVHAIEKDWKMEGTNGSRRLEFFDNKIYEELQKYTVEKYHEKLPCAAFDMSFIRNKQTKNVEARIWLRYFGTTSVQFKNEESDSEFLKYLEEAGLISCWINNGEKGFSFGNIRTWRYFMKEGNAYELYVYLRMRNSGLFNNVGLGVHSSLDSYSDFRNELDDILSHKQGYGLAVLYSAIEEINKRREILEQHMDAREIDVVAMYKMTPVFVSCKAKTRFEEADVNEIEKVANQLNGVGILCVIRAPERYMLHNTSVSILSLETVRDKEKFKNALEQALAAN